MRCKSDLNQMTVVQDLRSRDVLVKIMSMHGVGFDLLCEYEGNVYLVEVKQKRLDKLTEREEETMQSWNNYLVITSADDFFRQIELCQE